MNLMTSEHPEINWVIAVDNVPLDSVADLLCQYFRVALFYCKFYKLLPLCQWALLYPLAENQNAHTAMPWHVALGAEPPCCYYSSHLILS